MAWRRRFVLRNSSALPHSIGRGDEIGEAETRELSERQPQRDLVDGSSDFATGKRALVLHPPA